MEQRFKWIAFALIAIIVVIVVGLFFNEPYKSMEGIVYEKEIVPERIEENVESLNGVHNITHLKSYVLYVKYEVSGKYSQETKMMTKAFYVSEDVYNKTRIGDSYLYNKEKDGLEPMTIKEKVSKEASK